LLFEGLGEDRFGGLRQFAGVTTPTRRWEQAFSDAGGEAWET